MAETGLIYDVELIDVLPLTSGGMNQQLPTKSDLELTRSVSERTAAGYEVLLSHYLREKERNKSWRNGHAVQEQRHKDEVFIWRRYLEKAICNAEDIASGRASELEKEMLEFIEQSKQP